MALPKKILVPVDFSPCSTAALELATELADKLGGTLDVLHVRPDHREGELGHTKTATPVEPASVAAAELVALLERSRQTLGERVHSEMRVGDPEASILQAARDGQHDFIAMGTHGRTGRMHMLAGSVAEGIIRNAPCPVLVVRVPC